MKDYKPETETEFSLCETPYGEDTHTLEIDHGDLQVTVELDSEGYQNLVEEVNREENEL